MAEHSKIKQSIKEFTNRLRTKTQQEILHDIQRAFDKADWFDLESSILSLQTTRRPPIASKSYQRARIKVGEEHQIDLSLLRAPVRIQNHKHAALPMAKMKIPSKKRKRSHKHAAVPMAKMKILSKRRKRSMLQLQLIHLLEIIDELDMPSLYDIELRIKNIFDFDIAIDVLEELYDKQKWNDVDDILLYLCDTFNTFRVNLGIRHKTINCKKLPLSRLSRIDALLQTPSPLHKLTQRRLQHIKRGFREPSPEV